MENAFAKQRKQTAASARRQQDFPTAERSQTLGPNSKDSHPQQRARAQLIGAQSCVCVHASIARSAPLVAGTANAARTRNKTGIASVSLRSCERSSQAWCPEAPDHNEIYC